MGFLKSALYVLAFAFGSAVVASAQAAAAGVGPGTSISIGAGYSAYHLEYGQRWLGGAQVWGDANVFWRTGLEFEARQLRQNQDLRTNAATYLVGPRVSLRPGRIEPYVKLMVGAGHLNFPYSYARGEYFVASGGAGVDLHLGRRLNVRLIDLQYQDWPKFTFGSMDSYGISSGISFTVYRGPSWVNE